MFLKNVRIALYEYFILINCLIDFIKIILKMLFFIVSLIFKSTFLIASQEYIG